MAKAPERKLNQEDIRLRCNKLFQQSFERPRGLHGKARWRKQHFFLDPAVDPPMPGSEKGADGLWHGQWQAAGKQSTRIQAVLAQWMSRVCENTWKVECRPMRDTIPGKAKANKAEALLVQGFDFIRERTGIDVQWNLSFGKAIPGVGVLHWRVDTSIYDDMPDYDERDDLSEYEDADEDDEPTKTDKAKERDRYEYDEGTKRYREKPDSLKDRIARYKAECGFPVFLETLPLEQCAWRLDMSTRSQIAEFAVKRVLPSLEDWKADKLKQISARPRLGMAQDIENSLTHWMPSDSADSHDVTLYQYWARDYWYEWADIEGEYFDSGRHWYGSPPFAIDAGRMMDVADPVWAYLPVFNAMLEEKPFADRDFSILRMSVEESAVKTWVLQPTGQPVTSLTDDGDSNLDMNPGSTNAVRPPQGYKLEGIGGEGVNSQLFKVNEMVIGDMDAAKPSTGFAQFSATTQPTSAWQEQAQENMEPKQHIRNTARCLQVMVNSVIKCFADKEHGPGEVFGYAKTGDTLDRSTVLSLKPEDWKDIIADVRIQEVGNVEGAALQELGIMKLEKKLITPIDYYAQYEQIPNPEQYYAQVKAWYAFESGPMPNMIREVMAEKFGVEIALAPGAIPMVQGQQVTDEQAISAMGGTPLNGQGGAVPGSQGLQAAAPNTQMNGQMPRAQIGVAAPAGVM